MKRLILVLTIAGLAVSPFLGSPVRADWDGRSVFNLTSSWTDQNGHRFKLPDLAGKPWVVAMVYTRCQYACPLIVGEMKKIEAELPRKSRDAVRFILISMDVENDTPATMSDFLKSKGLLPGRWLGLTGGDQATREFAAVLGMKYRKIGKEFSHSNMISVIDAAGVVHYQQFALGKNRTETVDAIQKLFLSR